MPKTNLISMKATKQQHQQQEYYYYYNIQISFPHGKTVIKLYKIMYKITINTHTVTYNK